ncbi:MAG: peptidase T [Chitinophagales bacterium]|nr:peptidase T [Chitinophagales bacterium]MDW8393249.1 peptidase T [Chitinophagales bacterium]
MDLAAEAPALISRFFRYVKIDTQSDPDSATSPSTEKQKVLSRMLVEELRQLGIADAHLDEYGLVYATIPSNSPKKVPVICFCAHVDTSPDLTGAGVQPILHRNYQGGNITLPGDPSVIIRPEDHPDLMQQIGNDIITADGTTLLGADNKAGVAVIMQAAQWLMQHPDVRHGTIKLLFTPDEEIGRGVDHVDMAKLGADYGYTVDGESLGTVETETWWAKLATVVFHGVSAHPGFAKGKMENAVRMAAAFVHALPLEQLSPESTAGREGFIHPVTVQAALEQATVKLLLRDFTQEGLMHQEALIRSLVQQVMQRFPRATCSMDVQEQYRNMKEVLDRHPRVVDYALEAIRRSGLEPRTVSVRGGTDGSRLSFMGLPCPNLFVGEHAFHSRYEWVSVQDMLKSMETMIHLCRIWEDRG